MRDATAERGLTTAQAARRRRVLDAAMELGATGGYDAVQMRDVAAEADVALGTIYRYFSSKDHLLAESMVDWSADLEQRFVRHPPTGSTMAERTVSVVRRATGIMEQSPALAAALVTAVSANDPAAAECQSEITAAISRVLSLPLDDLDFVARARVVRVLNHVWNSALLRWVNGVADVAQVGDDLEDAARLLLEGLDAGRDDPSEVGRD